MFFFLRLRRGEMFQKQCDPQIEGKARNYELLVRGRDWEERSGMRKDGKEELFHLSESAGRTSAGIFDRT